ncbi:CAP domain-containing protein [Maribacter sp. 2304DJ31-5]|uniref:CAP domain-containing protein n=1 Tax=Maribacter sp. 2304DJ31-5 TaxID=3386273 RepID=UPI0039BC4B10
MKMRLHHAILVLFVFIISCTSENLDEDTTSIVTAENNVQLEEALLELVNEHRVNLGINNLEFSEVAYKYANSHNDYMIAKGSLSHDNFSSRASNINSEEEVEMVAENVAKDYNTAQQAFQGWYTSSNHKKTMEGDFTHTAVSVKEDENGNYYFTQLFYKK